MKRLTLLILLAGACGDDKNNKQNDAAIDSPANIDAPNITLDCQSYCSAIQAACTTANLQYSDMQTCVQSCMDFPMGALTDQSGDTLGCRINHTMLARTDPATHCVHAGPSGGGVCGDPCNGFCDIAVAECPTQWKANTCATQCGGLTQTPPYTANVQTGNNVSCRIYHAQAASVDPTTHCPHTALNSTGGPCS